MGPNDVARVTPWEVWKAREAGEQVALVDVRGHGRFADRRIAGALHCFLKDVEARLADFPASARLVFY